MMQADIRKIERNSRFFADMIEMQYPLSGLKDGVVYVVSHDGVLTQSVILKAKESLASCKSRFIWLVDYDCDFMPEGIEFSSDSSLGHLMAEGYNLVMPVATPDRNTKIYLVGKINQDSFLEPAVSFLSRDAEEITSACLPYALLNISPDMWDMLVVDLTEEEYGKWVQQSHNADFMIGKSSVVFRGHQAVNAMSVFGDKAVEAEKKFKDGTFSYQEGRKKLAKLASIIKKMKSDNEEISEKAFEEYQVALAALSKYEMYGLLQKFLLSNKPSDIKRSILEITDRETMGQNTQFQIILLKREKNRKLYNFHDDWDYWLFVQEKNGELYPIKMQKSSLTIYVMSLIEKVTKNQKNTIVDIRKNKKAYIDVNRLLFGCSAKTAEESFKGLDLKIKNRSEANRQGKLGECYSDIESALQTVFKYTGENYSPFLANRQFPLSISKEKIHLPEVFLSLIIH